jgi:UDP-N-acetylmuramoyl-tripeptide--D-alanyl-D-alanine ligase
VVNATAAAAVGYACGLSLGAIRDGLEAALPQAGRLLPQRGRDAATVVDDCYNANPGSVMAAIDWLATCSGRRTLILGAMRELGEDSAALHAQVGGYARECGIEALWGVGAEVAPTVTAFGPGGRHFADRAAVLSALEGAFGAEDVVLVKGSRGAAMESVLTALLATPAGGED